MIIQGVGYRTNSWDSRILYMVMSGMKSARCMAVNRSPTYAWVA